MNGAAHGEVVRAALTPVLDFIAALSIDDWTTPTPHSPAALAEMKETGAWRRERLVVGRHLAAARLMHARDCFFGALACFDGPGPAAPCHALGRVIIENTSRAWWVLGENVTDDERVRRSAADELEGLRQRARLAAEDAIYAAGGASRVAAFELQLAANGMEAAAYPKATQVVVDALGAGTKEVAVIYRLLSAVPHGGSHVVMSSLRSYANFVEPIRLAAFGFLSSFDVFARRVGMASHPDWRRVGKRAYDELGHPDWRASNPRRKLSL